MITARNYAAQCVKAMRDGVSQACATRNSRPEMADVIDEYAAASSFFAGIVEDAQHFVMPDNGELFDDNLRGIASMQIRLPFKSLTVEYYVRDFCGDSTRNVEARKRVILACETGLDNPISFMGEMLGRARGILTDECPKGIVVTAAYCHDGAWVLDSGMWVLPEAWDNDCGVGDKVRFNGSSVCCGTWQALLPRGIDYAHNRHPHLTDTEIMHDITTEIGVLLEFLEAMSCSNVGTTVHQEAAKNNEKRVRQGKVPVWETKILTVEVPRTAGRGVSQGGSHASPKQHLRRGHIRRLPSGNIWVNSCVVGSPENGNVEKIYALKKSS